MSFSNIRQAIIGILDDAENIQKAYSTPRSLLDGYPAAVVEPSENQADWGSTSTDRRVYVFRVTVYYPMKDQDSEEASELALEKALDEIVDTFSKRNILGSAADWVEPVPGAWAYEERGETMYRIGTVTLRCITYVPVTA
jgi:hypothetical protein